MAQSWPKRGEKGYLKSKRRKVKLTAPCHEICFVECSSRNFRVFGFVKSVTENSNQQTFLNNSQDVEKENENNFGSRIVNLDSFMKEMDKCKSCHEGNIFHEQTKCSQDFI